MQVADNFGSAAGCAYSCATLQARYFPGEESRCFLFGDTSVQLEPESSPNAGWPTELIALKKSRLDWNPLSSQVEENSAQRYGISFTVGDGIQCTNITISTSVLDALDAADLDHADSGTEMLCLPDGFHEFNHTVTSQHTVDIVGYEQVIHSATVEGAGLTTNFALGECTDMVIRMLTTQVSSGPTTWTLSSASGHNGAWSSKALHLYHILLNHGSAPSVVQDHGHSIYRQPWQHGNIFHACFRTTTSLSLAEELVGRAPWKLSPTCLTTRSISRSMRIGSFTAKYVRPHLHAAKRACLSRLMRGFHLARLTNTQWPRSCSEHSASPDRLHHWTGTSTSTAVVRITDHPLETPRRDTEERFKSKEASALCCSSSAWSLITISRTVEAP